MANPKGYLIIAYYNRQKWHRASSKELDAAEQAADDLFPDKNPKSFQQLASQGEFMPRSFDSDLFAKIKTPYSKRLAVLEKAVAKSIATAGIPTVAQNKIVADTVTDISRDVRDLIVDKIYASQPLQRPVGWMVVVDANYFASYIDRMGGNGNQKGLWPVFNIEILPLEAGWDDKDVLSKVPPLRDDANTKDIYDFMTPTNWGH